MSGGSGRTPAGRHAGVGAVERRRRLVWSGGRWALGCSSGGRSMVGGSDHRAPAEWSACEMVERMVGRSAGRRLWVFPPAVPPAGWSARWPFGWWLSLAAGRWLQRRALSGPGDRVCLRPVGRSAWYFRLPFPRPRLSRGPRMLCSLARRSRRPG